MPPGGSGKGAGLLDALDLAKLNNFKTQVQEPFPRVANMLRSNSADAVLGNPTQVSLTSAVGNLHSIGFAGGKAPGIVSSKAKG